jgi:hypothetical protein
LQLRGKLKKILVVLGAITVMGIILCQLDWHLNRNAYNKTPIGLLTLIENKQYQDEVGSTWELQPHDKNIFHQPASSVSVILNPYPNILDSLPYDPNNSNLKFLCIQESGSSFEVIIQPDGTYLNQGNKKGTYNYFHPSGFWGNTMHIIVDVIPHLITSKYAEDPK